MHKVQNCFEAEYFSPLGFGEKNKNKKKKQHRSNESIAMATI